MGLSDEFMTWKSDEEAEVKFSFNSARDSATVGSPQFVPVFWSLCFWLPEIWPTITTLKSNFGYIGDSTGL